MSQMLRSSGALATATLTSRVFGLAREMVYAAFMGNTWVASAFTLAFQVPNLFRRLLGQRARPFFRAGARRGDAERGDDLQRFVSCAAPGRHAGETDFRPRHRCAGGGPRPGRFPTAQSLSRRVPLPMELTLA